MKFTRLTGVLIAFLSVRISYAMYGSEIYEHNTCSSTTFNSLIESSWKNLIDQRSLTETESCSYENSICVYLGEEITFGETYQGFRITSFIYGNEFSLITSHDNVAHPIPIRHAFKIITNLINLNNNFECNSNGGVRKTNTTTFHISNDLCCIGEKLSMDKVPESFPGVLTATKLPDKTLHFGMEMKKCDWVKTDLFGERMKVLFKFMQEEDTKKFVIKEAIGNIGESTFNIKRESTKEDKFNERIIGLYKIFIPFLESSLKLRSDFYKESGKNKKTGQKVEKMQLRDDDDNILLSFISETEDNDQKRIFKTINLYNEKGNIIRKRAIKSILESNPGLKLVDPVQLLKDKRYRIDSELLKFSANSSTYRWNSGEYEEWIFQEVESSIFPALNHSICQLNIIYDGEGWESVVIKSPLFEASVYAMFDEDGSYMKKVCRVNFQLGYAYNSLHIVYNPRTRGHIVEAFMYGAEDAWKLSIDKNVLPKFTNYFLTVNHMDVWTTFAEALPVANISMTIANWPRSNHPLVEINIFNYKFLLDKLNCLVSSIAEVFLSRGSPALGIFDFIEYFLEEKSQRFSSEMEEILYDALKFRDYLLKEKLIPKITQMKSIFPNIFVHKSFLFEREDENHASIIFTLESILATIEEIFS